MTSPDNTQNAQEPYHPRDNATGQYTYSVDRPCVCGHGLEFHAAESPRACGNYGTGLIDCDCRKYRPSRKKPDSSDTQNASTDLEAQLDEIDAILRRYDYDKAASFDMDSKSYDQFKPQRDKAKQALTKLIADREREARIDEIQQVDDNFGWQVQDYKEDRLAELRKEGR